VALGNIGDPVALPALNRMLNHPESMVRSHAAWALGRIGGHEARQCLRVAQQTERETEVLGEIERTLEMI